MSRYIDADMLSDALRHLTLGETDAARATMKITHYVSRMPTADVRENVRGEWITTYLDHVAMGERPKILYCSVCNQCIAYPTNYCPNCGADMRPISALSENVEIVSNLKRGES